MQVRSIQGESLVEVSNHLKNCKGILSVAAFGNSIHVSAQDNSILNEAIESINDNSQLIIKPVEANREDIFISLIATAKDNYGPG